ncbi:MAG: acyl-ACP--UDP-N-acetylglucosamine O-acyltransferase, partial [Prevotella sp.]
MMSELYYVHPDARIGKNVTIEPFAYIAADVTIGDGSWIGPHAVIFDHVRLGKGCRVFPGAVIGAVPQDLKFQGEVSYVEIGDNT